jgi:hypothetical protein
MPRLEAGDTVHCGGCDAVVEVQEDIDGEYIDCPESGNFGYIA